MDALRQDVLKEQLAIHDALKKTGRVVPFVFHRDGERIKYFRAAREDACKEAGCPNAIVHDMRRSAVRTFERAGVPRSAAMSIVGHKTESIYRRYAIVGDATGSGGTSRCLDGRPFGTTLDGHRYCASSK